jgi:hypothetical protein
MYTRMIKIEVSLECPLMFIGVKVAIKRVLADDAHLALP